MCVLYCSRFPRVVAIYPLLGQTFLLSSNASHIPYGTNTSLYRIGESSIVISISLCGWLRVYHSAGTFMHMYLHISSDMLPLCVLCNNDAAKSSANLKMNSRGLQTFIALSRAAERETPRCDDDGHIGVDCCGGHAMLKMDIEVWSKVLSGLRLEVESIH